MPVAWYVDDDEEMLQAISLLVEMAGYQTKRFLSAKSTAKELLNGQRPDILLLDVLMPETSGIDFLTQIRTEMKISDLPIIMVSAEFNDVQINEALERGADAYLLKPVSLEELQTAIEQALSAPQP